MKILDFANNRRAFLLSSSKPEDSDYKFFLSSGRKDFLHENKRDLQNLQDICPEVLVNKINKSDLYDYINYDVLLTTSCSLYFKEYQKEAVDFFNAFKGHIISIDYAWDVARTKYNKKVKQLKKDFWRLAILMNESETPIKTIPFAQPEIDIYAHNMHFIDPNKVKEDYGLPDNKKYVLVTSHSQYDLLDKCIAYLKNQDVFIIWKLKEKQNEFADIVRSSMKKQKMTGNYTIVCKNPNKDHLLEGKSHTEFVSPVCELSTVIDYHVNMPPISFSQAEMIRAGVPTYLFNKKGLDIPDKVKDLSKKLWSEDSVNKYFQCKPNTISRASIKVDKLFFSKNLWKDIGGSL